MDKLIKKTNLALVVGTNSWRDQFMEAITVSAGTVGLPSGKGGVGGVDFMFLIYF